MNKRQQSIVDRYHASDMTELYHAYKSVSSKKCEAWDKCKKIYADHETRISPLKVIGAGSFRFSAGFEFTDPDAGHIRFCYISDADCGGEEWDE